MVDLKDFNIIEIKPEPCNEDPEYLGDGVYAAHEGAHICIRVGSHLNSVAVMLDRDVLAKLIAYAYRIGLTK